MDKVVFVSANTIARYQIPPYLLRIMGLQMVRIRAGNLNWNEFIVDPLVMLCIQEISREFIILHPVYSLMPLQCAKKLCEILSTEMDLDIVLKEIEVMCILRRFFG